MALCPVSKCPTILDLFKLEWNPCPPSQTQQWESLIACKLTYEQTNKKKKEMTTLIFFSFARGIHFDFALELKMGLFCRLLYS